MLLTVRPQLRTKVLDKCFLNFVPCSMCITREINVYDLVDLDHIVMISVFFFQRRSPLDDISIIAGEALKIF